LGIKGLGDWGIGVVETVKGDEGEGW
jgi:hypothetical protein